MDRNSCYLSLNLILSYSIFESISRNSICLLCIIFLGVYPRVSMLHGTRFPVVVVVSRASDYVAVTDTARSFCVVAVGRDAFGCASDPCRIVACAGDAIVSSFS